MNVILNNLMSVRRLDNELIVSDFTDCKMVRQLIVQLPQKWWCKSRSK